MEKVNKINGLSVFATTFCLYVNVSTDVSEHQIPARGRNVDERSHKKN